MGRSRNRSASSRRWLQRQQKDPFVKAARRQNRRSRASFKLEQIDGTDRLFRPGQRILDLGAAPGGWSQYLATTVGAQGTVVAVDLLSMPPLAGVDFILGDFLEPAVRRQVHEALADGGCDFVVSDMAPNLSGIRVVDEARAGELVAAALEIAREVLKPGGGMVVKVFEGAGAQHELHRFRRVFDRVVVRKPTASRGESSERFLVARGYNPAKSPEFA